MDGYFLFIEYNIIYIQTGHKVMFYLKFILI